MPYVTQFETYQKRRNLSAKTIRGRRFRLHSLSRFLHDRGKLLLEADAQDIEDWFDSLGGAKGIAPQTRHHYTRAVAAFYRWAIRERLIDDDPTEDVIKPRLPRGLPRPMDPADLVRAMNAADDRMAAMLALAGYAGLRCQEIAGLRVEDVDWNNARLLVVHGKGGKERVVPMHPELASRLRRIAPKHGYMLTKIHPVSSAPLLPDTISSAISKFLRSQGIAASAHNGRHLFLTSIYECTQDIRVTQELAGHASPTTTARYAAWSESRGAEAVASLRY